ncbi:hypothetical protein HPB50_022780 [Hyalomma asiaticum]|uniref:Uncharacterized protein n=1 Tax=Hyalomma asiaticum TaxID=266040 RepID=A0ACB7TMC7_HYAAI|nr:hypothetical protein HPB50_022780 [Hyalomma asiaticum]
MLTLKLGPGVTIEDIPRQIKMAGEPGLIVVSGRAPLCLRCTSSGHIRRDCQVPRCTLCHRYGHGASECAKSYARAVGSPKGVGTSEHLMKSRRKKLLKEQWPQLAQADVKASVNKDTKVNPDGADADKPESMDLTGPPAKRTHEDAEVTATRPVGEGQPPSKTAPHRRTPYRPRPNLATSRSVAETPPSAPT